MGFDPTICGSEDRRDVLTTLRALYFVYLKGLYNLSLFKLAINSQLLSLDRY